MPVMSRVLVVILSWAVATVPAVVTAATLPAVVATLHTYEARIRLAGKVSTTQVKASDAGHARKLVQQQFPQATVLSVKKVD